MVTLDAVQLYSEWRIDRDHFFELFKRCIMWISKFYHELWVNNEKLEIFKLESLKLESFAEVEKSQVKLERTTRSSKEPNVVQ